MKKLLIICIGAVLLALIGCAQKVNREAETAAVKETIGQFYGLYITKDAALLSEIVAHDEDMVNFGTDAVEHWVGWEALKEALQKQWEAFENPEITVRDQVIHLSLSGTVAWYTLSLDFDVVFGREAVAWKGARSSGVLEKRDGKWVIVQFHNSMPVTEQTAAY